MPDITNLGLVLYLPIQNMSAIMFVILHTVPVCHCAYIYQDFSSINISINILHVCIMYFMFQYFMYPIFYIPQKWRCKRINKYTLCSVQMFQGDAFWMTF